MLSLAMTFLLGFNVGWSISFAASAGLSILMAAAEEQHLIQLRDGLKTPRKDETTAEKWRNAYLRCGFIFGPLSLILILLDLVFRVRPEIKPDWA